MLDFASVNRFYNRLSAREMPIQGADADAGAARDLFQAHIQSDARKPCLGGAGFALRGSWVSFHDYRSTPHITLAKRRMPPYIKRRCPPLAIRPLLWGPAVGIADSREDFDHAQILWSDLDDG